MAEEEGTSIEALKTALLAKIECQHLMIQDVSACGCGQKFVLFACSDSFKGLAILKRHQLVQEILKEEIAKLHALTLKLWTPEEWEKKKDQIPADLVELL